MTSWSLGTAKAQQIPERRHDVQLLNDTILSIKASFRHLEQSCTALDRKVSKSRTRILGQLMHERQPEHHQAKAPIPRMPWSVPRVDSRPLTRVYAAAKAALEIKALEQMEREELQTSTVESTSDISGESSMSFVDLEALAHLDAEAYVKPEVPDPVREPTTGMFCKRKLAEWLYESADWAPPGYHVLCADSGTGSTFELFRGGHSGRKVQWDSKISSMSSLRKQLEKKAHMEPQEMWKVLPWLLADTSGVPVQDLSAVQGLLLLFEGGRWVWPGIREGFQRRVALPTAGEEMNVTLKTLTLDPLSFTIEDFFDKASAERMIKLAKPKLRPAEIMTQDSQKENVEDLGVEVRTCWETWLSPKDGPDLENVAQRSAALVRVPRELQADFRVLRYEPGQHFGAHTDYYEPEDFQEQPEVLNELQNGRNWLVTVYLYLSTVAKGGATHFPSSSGGPLPSDVLKCEGPAVKPRRGRALMFYSLHPNGRPNLSSMHGACKVEKGVKYTINIWTFNQLKPEFNGNAKKGKGEKRPNEL